MVAEWETEPDTVSFQHRGYECHILRGHMKTLCGYVGLPVGHALHGKNHRDYIVMPEIWEKRQFRGLTVSLFLQDDAMIEEGMATLDVVFNVHGGITYSSNRLFEGETEVWYFGFDCGHYMDFVPGLVEFYTRTGLTDDAQVYRNLAFVRAEVERLANQLRLFEEDRDEQGDVKNIKKHPRDCSGVE